MTATDQLRMIADLYAGECIRGNNSPATAIAYTVNAPTRTVQRWIYEARKAGLIAPTTPGVREALKRRSVTCPKCSHEFVVSRRP